MARETDRSPSDTGTLIRAVQQGDDAAARELFARYLPRVRQIAALRMGRPVRELVDVEDVVQATLLATWRSIEKYDTRSDTFAIVS